MKVSVVIPLYNKAPYIRRAVESALRQSFMSDEVIVVDDGSTDSSAAEVKKIADSHLCLIQQPNAGECAARNRGVAEAKNELVAFLDADDEWKPDFLLHIQRLVNNFPDCGAYATAYEVVSPYGNVEYPSLGHLPPSPWIGIIPDFFKLFQVTLPFFPSSIAIAKTAYHALGGFPVGVKRGGDLMMWIRLGMRYPVAYSSSRQVIYHTEAVNRACVIFPSNNEGAHTIMIAGMLEKGEIPADLLPDVMDYCVQEQIGKAKELIQAGHSDSARMLLEKAKNNRKYHRDWLWWSFWSLVPYPLLEFARKLRHYKEAA